MIKNKININKDAEINWKWSQPSRPTFDASYVRSATSHARLQIVSWNTQSTLFLADLVMRWHTYYATAEEVRSEGSEGRDWVSLDAISIILGIVKEFPFLLRSLLPHFFFFANRRFLDSILYQLFGGLPMFYVFCQGFGFHK